MISPARHSRTRLLGLLFCAILAILAVSTITPGHVMAQEPPPAGGNGGANPPPPAGAQGEDQSSMFIHLLKSLGLVFGIIILALSIVLIALIVLLAMDLRMGGAIPAGFVEDFTDVVNKRRFKEAYDLAREDGSFLGRVMTAGMGRLQYGIEDAREAAFNMIDSIKAGKEQLIAYLATIGTVGPLLGLVGTVYGMIGAFRNLGGAGGDNSAEISGHIAQALVSTLFGVAVALPAIFCHAFFRNRLIRLSMDTAYVADDLLTQMYHNSKKPAPPGGAAPAQAAAPDMRGGAQGGIRKQ